MFTLAIICIVAEAAENRTFKFIYEKSEEENSATKYKLTRFIHFTVNANVGNCFKIATEGEMSVTSCEVPEDPLKNLQKLWNGCINGSFPSEYTLKLDSVQLNTAIFSDTAKVSKVKVEGDVDVNFNFFQELRNNHEQLREGCFPLTHFEVKAEWGIPGCRGLGGLQAAGDVKINIFEEQAYFKKLQIKKLQ